MANDPGRAFEALMRAWEEFHAAVIDAEDPDAPRVLHAGEMLANAYTMYDDIIFTNYGVEAPFDTFDDSDEDSDFDTDSYFSADSGDDFEDDDFDDEDFDSDYDGDYLNDDEENEDE